MDRSLVLPDETALADLGTYLSRADRIDRASARLVATSGVLAVYTAVLHPAGLMDETPTVLGLRTIAVEPELDLDAVVPIASLVERVRGAEPSTSRVVVGLPAEVHTVTWAGVAPPRKGWKRVDATTTGRLAEAARAGIATVARVLPTDAGEALVRRVRSDVWSEPLDETLQVPAGAAFAADTLGFLGDPDEEVPVYETGPWIRLTTVRGHVLVKRRGWSLSRG